MPHSPPRPLTGIIAATVTPMRADGSLDPDRIPPMIDWVLAQGVNGLFVCGTTGEGLSLTIEERKRYAEIAVTTAAGRVPVVVHAGHNCLPEAADLARHAADSGADAISAAPPNYFPSAFDETVAGAALIADAALDLPFYYYHIPSMSGVALDMPAFLEAALDRIPSFAGVKYTHDDLAEFKTCLDRFGDRTGLLFGRDELLIDGLKLGLVGAVGSTYNYAGTLYHALWAEFDSGNVDGAEAWQARSRAFIEILARYGGCAATKIFMAARGMDCGPNRLPLKPFDENTVAALRQELDALGFFEWLAEAERALPA